MKGTYRRRSLSLLCLLFVFALTFTACAGNDSATSETEPDPETEETGPAPESEESTSTPESSETNSPSEHTVQHALGEAEVPADPQRVVVLDNGALDNVLALGVKPVGAPTVSADEQFFSYLQDQAEGIENIGTIDQPNLESISALKPDLIIGNKDTNEAIYDKLQEIAPTVITPSIGFTWKENLTLQAEALGKTEEVEKLLNDYDERLEEFKTKMGDRLEETTVSILRPEADHVRIYLAESFSGRIIQDAGLPRPAAQQDEDFAMEATEEQIGDLDGEVIFWFSRDPENILKTKIESSPLWADLAAVKNGSVYEVSDETWLSGLGIQSANLVIDDLIDYLVE